AAQRAVTRALAEDAGVGEAPRRILQVTCASAGWELGALWQVDREANLLHCVDVSHRPDIGVQEFETVTRQTPFPRGRGVPGQVWEQLEPVWVGAFAARCGSPRREGVQRAGLHCAFA